MDTTRHSREARDGTIGATAIMIAIVLAILAVAVPAGLVRDMGTLGDLFSILALPIMLAVFYTAQRLYSRARRDRTLILLEEDKRGKKYVMDTIDLCKALTHAVMQSGRVRLCHCQPVRAAPHCSRHWGGHGATRTRIQPRWQAFCREY